MSQLISASGAAEGQAEMYIVVIPEVISQKCGQGVSTKEDICQDTTVGDVTA